MKNNHARTFPPLQMGIFLLFLAGCTSQNNPTTTPTLRHNTAAPPQSLSTVAPVLTLRPVTNTLEAPRPNTTLAIDEVSGRVINTQGQVLEGAWVRQQTTENKTTTNQEGIFRLTGLPPGEPVVITAWFDGYYAGWSETQAGRMGSTFS